MHQVSRGSKVTLDHRGHQERLDHRVLTDFLGRKDHVERLAQRATLDS